MSAGTVTELRRYPVKSLLGEQQPQLRFGPGGVAGDRALALLDVLTGRVATAKQPRLWRSLLGWQAASRDDVVTIRLPDGRVVAVDDPDVDAVLSAVIGRRVRLTGTRPAGAAVERPDPEDVLALGVDADVPFMVLEIAQATAGGTFVDHSPVHLITEATCRRIGAEAVRYRPNLVLTTGAAAFAENTWVGQEIRIGDVLLRATLPTPRCSVPTLGHGQLPRAAHAVTVVAEHNRVDVPGFGVLPCAGLYAEVLEPGTVRVGDRVRVGP